MQSKLTIIQSKLKAPKGQYNEFGKYKYRNCEDILESLKPLLAETETEIVLSDEIELIGTRYYVKATATLQDSDGKCIAHTTAFAREPEAAKGQTESQITGATSSYARKYALNGLFGIDDAKDADTTNDGRGEPQKAEKKKAPVTTRELSADDYPTSELWAEAEAIGLDAEKLAVYLKLPNKDFITAAELTQAIATKKKLLAEKQAKAAQNG